MHRHRFDILLGTLVLLLLSAPVARVFYPVRHPYFARITVAACFTLVLISAVYAISGSRRTLVVALSLAVPVVLLSGMNVFVAQEGIVIAYHLLGILFLSYTAMVILVFLFRERQVTLNMVFASLCIYLLMGVLWADLYSLFEVLEPNSFVFNLAEEESSRSMLFDGERAVFPLYFSLVTMTTLGYGDIVPASSATRMLAAVQALTGQLYLTVLVARLVGLHISQGIARNGRNDDPSGDAPRRTNRSS